MNTPSPLVPQGTLPEGRIKSRTRIVVFAILAIHVVFVCVLLLQGCKRTTDEMTTTEPTNTMAAPPPPPPMEYPPVLQPTNPVPPIVTQVVVPPPVETPPPETIIAPPPPPPVTPEGKEHKVVKGDSFFELGKKYGVTSKAIAEANPGVDSTRLKIGQTLKIPAPVPRSTAGTVGGPATTDNGDKLYTVKSGDMLTKIARAHGVTVKALRAANNLRTDRITVGQKLKIPARGGVPEAPPAEGTVPPAPR